MEIKAPWEFSTQSLVNEIAGLLVIAWFLHQRKKNMTPAQVDKEITSYFMEAGDAGSPRLPPSILYPLFKALTQKTSQGKAILKLNRRDGTYELTDPIHASQLVKSGMNQLQAFHLSLTRVLSDLTVFCSEDPSE